MDDFTTNKAGLDLINFADYALSLPIEMLQLTLKQNSQLVNCKGFGGQTALHKAVLLGNHPVTLILLRCGADPNLPTNSGETSLHIASARGSLKIVATLLSFGGDLTVINQHGQYPIHCAALSGSVVVLQYLSEAHDCNLQMLDKRGATVLHSACASGNFDLVRFIVKVKKLMNLRADESGNTVLHVAANGGHSGICWTLLQNSGESLLSTRNNSGQTPLQIAENSLSVSRDCKYWLHKWTNDYEKNKKLPSPKRDYLALMALPFLVFHIAIILAVIALPKRQWLIGLPGFLILIFILKKQEHRILHPVRWANPIYVSAYTSAWISTFLRLLCLFVEDDNISRTFSFVFYSFLVILAYLIYILTNRDAGRIPSNGYSKDTLIKLSEDRLEGRYCPSCFIGAPSASHHCRLCDGCFLHLDHHCLFLNTCIASNNHWHFVIFIFINIISMSCFVGICLYLVPATMSEIGLGNWILRALEHWMCADIWMMLLLVCHVVSLMWAFSLMRYQFQVIGCQQTTYYRIKSGLPKTHYTFRDKVLNFCKFIFHRRVVLASSYFQA